MKWVGKWKSNHIGERTKNRLYRVPFYSSYRIMNIYIFFLQEILGGMLDLEPRRWRKPRMEKFEEQRKKVLEFSEWWKDYNWTDKIMK